MPENHRKRLRKSFFENLNIGIPGLSGLLGAGLQAEGLNHSRRGQRPRLAGLEILSRPGRASQTVPMPLVISQSRHVLSVHIVLFLPRKNDAIISRNRTKKTAPMKVFSRSIIRRTTTDIYGVEILVDYGQGQWTNWNALAGRKKYLESDYRGRCPRLL